MAVAGRGKALALPVACQTEELAHQGEFSCWESRTRQVVPTVCRLCGAVPSLLLHGQAVELRADLAPLDLG